MPIFEPILERLAERGGRFVVVGGLAGVLHGHARLTVDLGLVVDLDPDEVRRTLEALGGLGLVPLAPVDLRVFSLYDPNEPLRIVDLFVEEPLDFEILWSDAREVELGRTAIRVASIEHLIRMKQEAGRPLDLDDIERLSEIQRRLEAESQ